jgi:hypothetical protein
VVQPATPEPSLGQKIVGAGEAGLSTLTGLTGGTLGTVAGAIGGLTGAVLSGEYGTPEGAQRVEQAAAEGGQALTYAPRTASGQSQTEAIGNAIGQTIPAAAVLHTIPMTARPAMDMVVKPAQDAKTAALQAVKEKVMAAAARRQAANDPSAAAGTGTFGPDSIGAARVGDAQVRRSAAEDLGMTGDAALTKGQAERTFEQQRFEQEMAKDPLKGTAIRERAANQNARMWGNFDQWLDQTGAQKVQPGEVGDAVKEALIQRSQADINRTRVAYAKADNSPEADALVDPAQRVTIGEGEQALTSSPIDFLNSKPSGLATTALADHARQYALKLGVAEKGANGELVSVASPIRVMEEWRKEINAATDSTDPVQVRDATILKKMIDAQTEPVAGPLYQQARMLRTQYAQRYENVGLVYDLMNNKPGMADAKVAAEDVFRRAVLNGKMDEIKHLGRILKAGGDKGRQAWAELQGATVRYIRDEAARNITRNERGEEMVSAKGLDSAITSLDRAGKLDYLFGKQGAEKLRALNDLAKVLFTSPPGAVNHSNTASVILAALDMATSGMAGIPAPIFSGLRILTTHVKDRQIQKRINEALGIRPQPKVKAPASAPHRPIPPARAPENRTVH